MDPLASAGVRPPVDQFRPGFRALLDALTPEYFRQPEFKPPEPGTVGKVPQAELGMADMLAGGAIEAASMMTPAGAAKTAAIPLMGLAARYGKGPIRAFHGSPHDFNKFSLDKIGTGEGAQAYGQGLYFAENEGVARSYRDKLGGVLGQKRVLVDGQEVRLQDPTEQRALAALASDGLKNTRATVRNIASDPFSDPESVATWRRVLREYGGRDLKAENVGRMYEVGIHADPQRFLDWDAPLSAQPASVQKSLEPFGFKADKAGLQAFDDALLAALDGTGPTALPKQPRDQVGEDIYRSLTPGFVSSGPYRAPDVAAASTALREAGIPGIRYLDAGSRAAGDGSRNYVVFDDSIIEILRKYGLAGLAMLPPAVAATMLSQNEAQAQPSNGREQIESALMQRTTR